MGGSQEIDLFDHLPEESRARIKEKAATLLEIPTDKRVPFMVQQIRQAMSFRGLRGVEKIDPSWLMQGLKGESARVVATVLVSLPSPTVRALLKRLPTAIRPQTPSKRRNKTNTGRVGTRGSANLRSPICRHAANHRKALCV